MGEIIYQSILNLFKGINPYSVEYELKWGSVIFYQPLIYGPFAIIGFIPAMLLSNWVGSIWPGMIIINLIYEYLFCELLYRGISKDIYLQENAKIPMPIDQQPNRFIHFIGAFFWMIPFGPGCISTILPFPTLLVGLAFYYRNNVKRSSLFISLACITYQLCLLFLPYFIIYYIKNTTMNAFKFTDIINNKKVLNIIKNLLMGALPAIIIFLIFLFWTNPFHLIDSMFLYPNRFPYNKVDGSGVPMDNVYFSIPRLVYELSNGELQIGNQCRLIMFIILAIYMLYYLLSKKNNHIKTFYKYSILATLLFILTTNNGGIHYSYFLLLPIFILIQYNHPDFWKTHSNYYLKNIQTKNTEISTNVN